MEGPAGPRDRRQGAQHAGYVVSFLGSVARAMFMPSGYVVASCPLIIAALMAWAFLLGGRESPFSAPAYLVSGWALLVTSIWVARRPAKAGLRILCEKSRFFDRLVTDPDYRHPVIATIRRINLSMALIALFALETAMLSTYGTTPADEQLSFVMPIITGTVITVVIAVLGIRSIITASPQLKAERMKCAPNAAFGWHN